MCLAIPAKIVEIDGRNATAEISGVRRKIRIDLIENCKTGDHVLIHAGFAISKLDEETLRETREILEEYSRHLAGD